MLTYRTWYRCLRFVLNCVLISITERKALKVLKCTNLFFMWLVVNVSALYMKWVDANEDVWLWEFNHKWKNEAGLVDPRFWYYVSHISSIYNTVRGCSLTVHCFMGRKVGSKTSAHSYLHWGSCHPLGIFSKQNLIGTWTRSLWISSI